MIAIRHYDNVGLVIFGDRLRQSDMKQNYEKKEQKPDKGAAPRQEQSAWVTAPRRIPLHKERSVLGGKSFRKGHVWLSTTALIPPTHRSREE